MEQWMIEKLGHENLNPVDSRRPKRVAIVISNAANSTTTGWPVGFWWSELAHPFHVFKSAATRSKYSAPMAAPARPMR